MRIIIFFGLVWTLALTSQAAVVQLYNPNQLQLNRTTFTFDEYADSTPANSIYQNAGMNFRRDDGGIVPIIDWTQFSRATTSGSNVLATLSFPLIGPTQGFATHLILESAQPLWEVGAFFGNDSNISEFGFERLSIFGAANEFLGSVDVPANGNPDIDQFIGIRSSIPFYSVRFENFDILGNVSGGYSVAIDDLAFTPVPEPSTYALLGTGLICSWFLLRRRKRSRNDHS
jgi:hypothetical protein